MKYNNLVISDFDNIIKGIENYTEKYYFQINNFKTVYILVILIYAACIFILISQYNINKKLDRLLLYDKEKSDKISVVDDKISKRLNSLLLIIFLIIFVIIVFSSLN